MIISPAVCVLRETARYHWRSRLSAMSGYCAVGSCLRRPAMSLKPEPIEPVPEATTRSPPVAERCTVLRGRAGDSGRRCASSSSANKPAAAREIPCAPRTRGFAKWLLPGRNRNPAPRPDEARYGKGAGRRQDAPVLGRARGPSGGPPSSHAACRWSRSGLTHSGFLRPLTEQAVDGLLVRQCHSTSPRPSGAMSRPG